MTTILNTDPLREALSAGSPWAKETGTRLRFIREAAELSVRALAAQVDIPESTLYRIESGEIVPRDYLRAALAYVLAAEVEDIWRTPHRDLVAIFLAS